MSFSFTAIIILQLYSLSPVIIIIFISFFLLLLSVCVFRFFIERYCIDVTSFDMTSFSHLPHYLYITTGLFYLSLRCTDLRDIVTSSKCRQHVRIASIDEI